MLRQHPLVLFTLSLLLLGLLPPSGAHGASSDPHVAFRYEIHTEKGVYPYIGVKSSTSFEETWRTSWSHWETLKNMHVIHEAGSQKELLDWLCPRVELVWVETPKSPLSSITRLDMWKYGGVLHKRVGKSFPCMGWSGPRPESVGDDIELPEVPELGGNVVDCIRQSIGEDTPVYELGGPAFQAEMLRSGHIYVQSIGWVDGTILNEQAQTCTINHLEASIRRMARLQGGSDKDQEMIALLLASIMKDADPATRLARLQRLRNGIFMMIMADNYRAQAELAEEDVDAAKWDAITMFLPFVGDARDVYEIWDGRDAFTGQPLEWWQRALAVGGLIIGSGQNWRDTFDSLRARFRPIKSAPLDADKLKLLERSLKGGSKKLPKEVAEAVPDLARRNELAREIQQQAEEKVQEFIDAVKTRDPEKIQRALIKVQSDQQAIARMNRQLNVIKSSYNRHLKGIYDEVDAGLKKRILEAKNRELMELAHKSGKKFEPLSLDDISIVSVTNPADRIKVGRDRDYTIRIHGKDLPSDEASRYYNKELFEVLKRRDALPPGVRSPGQLGSQLEQTAVHQLDPEAYNRADLSTAVSSGRKPRQKNRMPGDTEPGEIRYMPLKDAPQIGLTIEYKGIHEFNRADDLIQKAKAPGISPQQQHELLKQAEVKKMDGMYQLRKQYDNQVLGRINAADKAGVVKVVDPDVRKQFEAAQLRKDYELAESLRRPALEQAVPPKLRKAMDILRSVEDPNGLTSAQAEALLKATLNRTPRQVAEDLKNFLQGWELKASRPRPGTGG